MSDVSKPHSDLLRAMSAQVDELCEQRIQRNARIKELEEQLETERFSLQSLCDHIELWLAHPDRGEAVAQIAAAVEQRRLGSNPASRSS